MLSDPPYEKFLVGLLDYFSNGYTKVWRFFNIKVDYAEEKYGVSK